MSYLKKKSYDYVLLVMPYPQHCSFLKLLSPQCFDDQYADGGRIDLPLLPLPPQSCPLSLPQHPPPPPPRGGCFHIFPCPHKWRRRTPVISTYTVVPSLVLEVLSLMVLSPVVLRVPSLVVPKSSGPSVANSPILRYPRIPISIHFPCALCLVPDCCECLPCLGGHLVSGHP